ncbi:hypothetical protein N24_0345 [Corynebacterium suranareeae]|uniref:Uncharacterized protein n=1 Tax=Corynebacterium suranareeae TaxID=2506452 RepID=A0A160PLK3_9CORY|nr:hypothetical protein N24_0345 [Corynebacterium suranareeae]
MFLRIRTPNVNIPLESFLEPRAVPRESAEEKDCSVNEHI